MNRIHLHLISCLTSLWVIGNLAFWMIPLTILSVGRVTLPGIRGLWQKGIEVCYRAAAGLNSFWMLRVIGIRIRIEGQVGDHPSPIIISNHQSWFDIPVIHHVVTGRGPIIKFLIKRQLVWVPIVGWLCWMLGFPRLYRGQGQEARQKDYETLQRFSNGAAQDGGAILIFPEGTRFTEAKRLAQGAPYSDLLTPRVGGLRILSGALPPDTPVVDLTIIYEAGRKPFWDCLHGAVPEIRVIIHHYRLADIDHHTRWLNQRWAEKQALIDQG
ncbi:MAG: 1-acyl-sn-glycerol-3-phosphate acyltransferase [Proteobacteria bacterium]|jgi:1-acyl-sn-glycerol-3-phosphate acyltransferase|nr:1-acyl-sn-glycerol-3-phosphate acyltransferase [Pseudomonadota bacterium]